MEHEEFLEKVFSETFKRESEESENVARTLPFFATSLAIVVTVLGYAAQHLGHIDGLVARHVSFGLLAAAALAVTGVLWCLFRAVWPRAYRILPPETELLTYSEELLGFHAGAGTENPSRATRDELRSLVVRELAHAAAENRANNAKRIGARSQAFVSLIAALTCAFLLGAAIFLEDRADDTLAKRTQIDGTTASSAAQSAATTAADTP